MRTESKPSIKTIYKTIPVLRPIRWEEALRVPQISHIADHVPIGKRQADGCKGTPDRLSSGSSGGLEKMMKISHISLTEKAAKVRCFVCHCYLKYSNFKMVGIDSNDIYIYDESNYIPRCVRI